MELQPATRRVTAGKDRIYPLLVYREHARTGILGRSEEHRGSIPWGEVLARQRAYGKHVK